MNDDENYRLDDCFRELQFGAMQHGVLRIHFRSSRREPEVGTLYRTIEWPHSGNLGGNTELLRPIFETGIFYF